MNPMSFSRLRLILLSGLSLTALSCGGMDASPSQSAPSTVREEEKSVGWGGEGGAADMPAAAAAPEAPPPPPGASARMAKPKMAAGGGARGRLDDGLLSGEMDGKKGADKDEAQAGDGGEAAPTRSWFPESFLWMPLVETDASGSASVQVQVPDTLTTWRVLALGLTREGAQGGSVAELRSTLPAYVDVNLPSFLFAGDRFAMPIQVLSQQAQALSSALTVTLRGGEGAGSGAVSVAPYGSAVQVVGVSVPRSGTLAVRAELGSIDAVEKSIPIRPVGMPVELTRGGTLGAPREMQVDGPPGATDGGMEVLVFPGALSVVAREIQVVGGRGSSAWDAAYAWRLTGMAEPMVKTEEVAPDLLRDTRLIALQRLRKLSRSPDLAMSVATLAALDGQPGDSPEGRLAIFARDQLRSRQQPDGLWPGGSTGLDDILVSTAQAVWALGPEERPARLRASGAFERYQDRLKSPYVAAWALVADAVEPQRREELLKLVTDNIQKAADGSSYLDAAGTRPDGSAATRAEATALAALVVADEAVRADLCSWLLAHYSPWSGFGDGLSGLLAVRALEKGLAGEIPASVKLTLTVDGQPVATGLLDAKQPHQPVRLEAPGVTGSHLVKIESDPPVPGLAFALAQRSYLPWVQAEPKGLDVALAAPRDLRNGQTASMEVFVAGPAGRRVTVQVGLPVPVTVERRGLEEMQQSGKIEGFQVRDGLLTIDGLLLDQGAARFPVTVTPTLSGVFQTEASSVALDGASFVRVPTAWSVR